jgi:hypothetical protein
LFGIPAWNVNGVLKVQLDTKEVKVLPLPRPPSYYNSDPIPWKDETANIDRGRWMWHGGAVGKSSDGKAAIYCPPSNAEHVLKVYLDGSDRVEEIGPALSVGQNKWYGGILGVDGCIYAPPYTATGVLRIDPANDSVEVLGDFPEGGWKWHGGLLAKNTGVLYSFPAHSKEILCVDTNVRGVTSEDGKDDESWRVTTIPIRRHENDTDSPDLKYKWRKLSKGVLGR